MNVISYAIPNSIFYNAIHFYGVFLKRYYSVSHIITPIYTPADLFIIPGIKKYTPRYILENAFKDKINAAGSIQINIENQLVGRAWDGNCKYYRIGLGHILKSYAYFGEMKSPVSDRWEQQKSLLDIDVKPWRKNGSHIVLVTQSPNDASLLGENHMEWINNTINTLLSVTDRKIVVKIHPNILGDKALHNQIVRHSKVSLDTSSIKNRFDCLNDAWCAVVRTSGMAIDCILAGIPVIATHRGNFAHPISTHDLSDIENVKTEDRDEWLWDMAYTQWNLEEIKAGDHWNHLKDMNYV